MASGEVSGDALHLGGTRGWHTGKRHSGWGASTLTESAAPPYS